MTKKKSIISKLFIALVALTLISCCFLGSTMARYTSGSNGSASVEVANWNITFEGATTNEGTFTFSSGSFSPSMSDYETMVGENAVNKLATPVLVATITNSGEVDATVTITVTDEAYFGTSGETPVTFDNTGYSYSSKLVGDGASEAQVEAALEIKFYYGTSETWTGLETLISGSTEPQTVAKNNGKLYVFADVVWTTNYKTLDTSESKGAVADAVDTWIGQKVGKVSCNISYTAVQASEQPTA